MYEAIKFLKEKIFGNKRIVVSVVVGFSVLVVLILLIAFFSGKGSDVNDTPAQVSGEVAGNSESIDNSESVDNSDGNEADIMIDMDYVQLLYPGVWTEMLRTEVDKVNEDLSRVAFFYVASPEKEYRIFDILLGEDPETAIGMIQVDDDQTVGIGVVMYELADSGEWSEAEQETIFKMQEDINYLLEKLVLVDSVVDVVVEDVVIETPYGNLYYPGQREQWIRTEIMDGEVYTVSFYCDLAEDKSYHLFDIAFGKSLSGNVGKIVVSDSEVVFVDVKSHEIPSDSGLNEEELSLIYEMQDELNYVLGKLEFAENESYRIEYIKV